MKIRIKKRTDGAGVLSCVREDGSESWQKVSGHQAPYFARHDLTHFAVETTFGYQRGFFGLLSEGWEFDDVTGKGTRGRLPPEALEVECLVGLLFSEQASHIIWTPDEFNQAIADYYSTSGLTTNLVLTGEMLAQVRKRRSELFRQWEAVPAGETMELTFE